MPLGRSAVAIGAVLAKPALANVLASAERFLANVGRIAAFAIVDAIGKVALAVAGIARQRPIVLTVVSRDLQSVHDRGFP